MNKNPLKKKHKIMCLAVPVEQADFISPLRSHITLELKFDWIAL